MCAASPMRSSGAGRPSACRIGRLSQGPGSAACGQVPSLSEPRIDHVGLLQARLVGLPDGDARMRGRARADASRRRRGCGRTRDSRPPRMSGAGTSASSSVAKSLRGRPRPPRPASSGAPARRRPRPGQAPRPPRRGPRRASHSARLGRRLRTAPPAGRSAVPRRLHQLARRLPVVGSQAAHAAVPALARRACRPAPAPAPRRRRPAPGRSRACGRRRAPACARPAAQLGRRHAEPAQRVLQQRHQRHRLEAPWPRPR